MLRTVVIVCAAALTLTACSSEEPSKDPDGDSIPDASTSILEKLTGQKMCDLLSDDAIEKAIDNTVRSGKVRRIGKLPITLSYTCEYNSNIGDQLNAWDLGVVATVNDERIVLTISVFGQRAEQAPMKSLAQELLTNLESAVR
jgi:hypothetical protein